MVSYFCVHIVADQCYGVAHQHKVSRVHAFDKDDALGFVKELMAEERGGDEDDAEMEVEEEINETPAAASEV